jgi:predicted dinucleotide-binding enzyme
MSPFGKENEPVTIAIIGAGNVGGTLGRRWAQGGHRVTFGVREVDGKTEALLRQAPNARAVRVQECARDAEVVVLATPWNAAESALRTAGDLAGKIVIDATNPLLLGAEGLKRGLLLGHTTSGGEQVAGWAPGARVVKAFNTTGWENMAEAAYPHGSATIFICGDDSAARATVTRLAEELGLTVVDAGGLTQARLLEPLGMLWIHLCFGMGWGTNFTFQMAKRSGRGGGTASA